MGKLSNRSTRTPVSPEDIRMLQHMQQQMAQVHIPLLQRGSHPHEYLYFAFLDGTGQDRDNLRLGLPTTVAHLSWQAQQLAEDPSRRVGAGYSAGIGSQRNVFARALDGVFALSWRHGIEDAYEQLSRQTEIWLKADPHAQIRVVGIGYSRGAVQTAGLLRLIERHGILPQQSLAFGTDAHGNITVRSKRDPLVPPGQILQAAMLLDPVATRMPRRYDARLPPSVVSRIAVMAGHEQRTLFPHQAIIASTAENGADQISARLVAPGGHSNIGGGNAEDGLEILTGNLLVDYLNQLRDEPLFAHRALPHSLDAYARYQAGGASAGFGLAVDDDSTRDLREELVSCIIVEPCRASEPVNQALLGAVPLRHYQQNRQQEEQLQDLAGRVQLQAALPAPSHRPDRDPPLFVQALAQLQRLGADAAGYTDPAEMERMAGGIALEAARRRIASIDEITLGDAGQLDVLHYSPRHAVFNRHLQVDARQLALTPLQDSLDQLAEQSRQHALDQMQQELQQSASQAQGFVR